MVFDSLSYFLFFFLVIILNYCTPLQYRWVLLLIASIFFYSYTNPVYLIVPLFISLFTYSAALQIEKANMHTKKQWVFIIAVVINAGLLVFFKYSNFFSNLLFDGLNFLNGRFAHSGELYKNDLLIKIIAPLGISYIIFQAIGYLIDVKNGNQLAEKNIGYFTTYILFFPKLIAGPVEKESLFLPQISKAPVFRYDDISVGLKRVIWGLFKKLVIADRLSIYVNAVYNNFEHHSGATLAIAAFFYTFQLYADFSGYTDMALGFAKMLGFDLMENFNRPFLAKSVTEFWRRFHMSLSSWFNEYFYTPLSIAKRDWGKWGAVYSLFITFIILGFWHGANWTFIIFGILQGCILSIEFFTRSMRKTVRKRIPAFLNTIAGIVFTISYYTFSLIFFRSGSVMDALHYIKRLFSSRGSVFIENPSIMLFSLMGIFFLAIVECKKEYWNELFTLSNNRNWIVRNCYYCFLLLVILIAGVFDGGEFIYFQF